MMELIDRRDELQRLERVASSGEGGLVVLWGRRRVGKAAGS
jgi:AAA+ ATPase superfamily predicted ATPase